MNNTDIVSIAQEKIGYTFKNTALLLTALTHSSFAHENSGCEDNEKLEFLGDAILNFLIAKRLFENCSSEGEMTKRRSKIVSRVPLKEAVLNLDLVSIARFGKGTDEKFLSDKSISDIFEAILAAIYLDSGNMACAERFMMDNLKDIKGEVDYKTDLQELVQARRQKVEYNTVNVGDVHQPFFYSVVSVNGAKYGEGRGKSKKEAEKSAAKSALNNIRN
jgi:ribonuclease-3